VDGRRPRRLWQAGSAPLAPPLAVSDPADSRRACHGMLRARSAKAVHAMKHSSIR